MAATALLWGMERWSGGGILFRNLERTVGLPRGANDGLEGADENSRSSLGDSCRSFSPSPGD